jgi:hypothetical protein
VSEVTRNGGVRTDDSLSEDAVIADSGAYSFGMAYCDVPDIQGQSSRIC